MTGSWDNLHGAVGLGQFQDPPPAITNTPDPLVEPVREPVAPVHSGAVRAGEIQPQSATPTITGPLFAPVSVLGSEPVILIGDTALAPAARFAIPAGKVALRSASLAPNWHVFPAVHAPYSPELQPSLEPRRIWNRVALSLPECKLGKSAVRPMAPDVATDLQQPHSSVAVPPQDRDPARSSPAALHNQGLPIERGRHIEQEPYKPAAAIRATRHIGPKLRVPLPTVPRVR